MTLRNEFRVCVTTVSDFKFSKESIVFAGIDSD